MNKKNNNENENENENDENGFNIILFRKEMEKFDLVETKIKEVTEHLKPLQKCLKDLKAVRNNMKQHICTIMKTHEIDVCNLPKNPETDKVPGAIKYAQTKSILPMTADQVKKLIADWFSNEYEKYVMLDRHKKAQHCIEYIYDKNNRPRIIKETLRKIKTVEAVNIKERPDSDSE